MWTGKIIFYVIGEMASIESNSVSLYLNVSSCIISHPLTSHSDVRNAVNFIVTHLSDFNEQAQTQKYIDFINK